MDVLKVLVIGEPKQGKTTLIQSFLDSKDNMQNEMHTSKEPAVKSQKPHTMDFVLKIMTINGKKIRIQLWDLVGCNPDPHTALTPLFMRNAVGCIVVAKADNPNFVNNSNKWKSAVDKLTHIPNQNSLPCALFMNHFSDKNQMFETALSVKPDLETLCKKIKDSSNYVTVQHLNTSSGEAVAESFESFIDFLIKDQETHKINMEDLWDESIKEKLNRQSQAIAKHSLTHAYYSKGKDLSQATTTASHTKNKDALKNSNDSIKLKRFNTEERKKSRRAKCKC